jgi:hypothetical protein
LLNTIETPPVSGVAVTRAAAAVYQRAGVTLFQISKVRLSATFLFTLLDKRSWTAALDVWLRNLILHAVFEGGYDG